jgi:hypothetical protein
MNDWGSCNDLNPAFQRKPERQTRQLIACIERFFSKADFIADQNNKEGEPQ